jgi:hypothetical protein
VPDTVESDPGIFEEYALAAPVWALIRLAEIAAETYEALEHPDERGSMTAAAEHLPRLRDALNEAGLLRQ